MGKRKTGLSFKEHQRIAARLYAMQFDLSIICTKLKNSYPLQGCSTTKLIKQAIKTKHTLDEFRDLLEKALHEENPEKGDIWLYDVEPLNFNVDWTWIDTDPQLLPAVPTTQPQRPVLVRPENDYHNKRG